MKQEPTFQGKAITEYTIHLPPKIKGAYVLGSRNMTNTIAFHLVFKPKWLHRQMMRIFLGWYWVDEK